MISSFRGEYWFLSNMYECPVRINDLTFCNAEAAFQACKSDHETAKKFVGLNGYEAKRLGRAVRLVGDWNARRIRAMKIVVKAKFTQNPELAKKLLATGDEELVEGNSWNDTFWGVCNGRGENHLGKILMEIREMLKEESYD